MSNKESVKLRQRLRPSGNTSLYLDIYRRGVRHQENLKLYLIPERNRADKEKNKQTLQLAEAIRSKRHIEVINGEYGFAPDSDGVLFFPYAEAMAAQRISKIMLACIVHLRQYERRDMLTFEDITPKWVEGFVRYLDGTTLATNTKRVYFVQLKTILHNAQAKGVLHRDPLRGVDIWKPEDAERAFLTIEELRILIEAECESNVIRRAFLFSCLTGLRISDIEKMTWGEVQDGEHCRITFRQKKTKGLEYLDINAQARALLGERGGHAERIFNGLYSRNNMNVIVSRWVLRAGIKKHITFHCARHTFAVMMLDLGTDIYTVSKLLGHRDIKTTETYAKILDKNKRMAVDNIPKLLDI